MTTTSNAGGRHAAAFPAWLPAFNVIARRLLAAGAPIGPDMLLTVRGRRTGLPRTTPVAICAHGDRRGVIAVFGETEWVRNLRADEHATLRVGRRREQVRAVELTGVDAVDFFRDVLAPQARADPINAWFVRSVDHIDIDDPEGSAVGRPVFELFPA
jgi:deazaflavin-dependent oxidoreductase (nitroreductase family)